MTNMGESPRGLTSGRRSTRLIALALTGLVAAVTALPPVAADNTVNCTLVDDGGAPMSGEVVVITNDYTHDQATVTTDGSGSCSTDAGGLGLQEGQSVTLHWVGPGLLISSCQPAPAVELTTKFLAADQLVLVGFQGLPQQIPTTLSLGKISSSRSVGNVVTKTNGLGFSRVQGNGSPLGHFNVAAVFRLKDNFVLPPPNPTDRVYDFTWTVRYKGYYDANCGWHAVPGIPVDIADDLHATFTNANLPYDSGDTTITKALNAGQLPLDAQKVGQGANDKLMEIEVEAQTFECDGTNNWFNCQNAGGMGPLFVDVLNTYYVEP